MNRYCPSSDWERYVAMNDTEIPEKELYRLIACYDKLKKFRGCKIIDLEDEEYEELYEIAMEILAEEYIEEKRLNQEPDNSEFGFPNDEEIQESVEYWYEYIKDEMEDD